MGPEERLHRTVCDPLIRIKGSWRSMESTSEEIFEMSSRDYQWVWTQWNQIPKLSNPLGNSTNYAIVLESNNDWQSKTTERHNSSDMTCIISYLHLDIKREDLSHSCLLHLYTNKHILTHNAVFLHLFQAILHWSVGWKKITKNRMRELYESGVWYWAHLYQKLSLVAAFPISAPVTD